MTIRDDILAAFDEEGLAVSVTYTVRTPGTYDPTTDTETGGSTSTSATSGWLGSMPERFVNGTTVLAGDRRLALRGDAGFVPDVGQRVTIGAYGDWQVISVQPVVIGGETVIYRLQVRK